MYAAYCDVESMLAARTTVCLSEYRLCCPDVEGWRWGDLIDLVLESFSASLVGCTYGQRGIVYILSPVRVITIQAWNGFCLLHARACAHVYVYPWEREKYITPSHLQIALSPPTRSVRRKITVLFLSAATALVVRITADILVLVTIIFVRFS